MYIYINMHTYTYMNVYRVYIYIYIYRRRAGLSHHAWVACVYVWGVGVYFHTQMPKNIYTHTHTYCWCVCLQVGGTGGKQWQWEGEGEAFERWKQVLCVREREILCVCVVRHLIAGKRCIGRKRMRECRCVCMDVCIEVHHEHAYVHPRAHTEIHTHIRRETEPPFGGCKHT